MFGVVRDDVGDAGKGGAKIGAEGLGADGDGSGKADSCGTEAGAKSNAGVVDAGEEIVFAAGAGQGGGEFRIAECAAEGEDAADDPKHDEGEDTVGEIGLTVLGESADLEAEAGEDAGADHVGDDEGSGGPGGDSLFRLGFHFSQMETKEDAGSVALHQYLS